MNAWRLIFRSLRYYWPTNLAITLGLAVATAVITGSLLVGASMRTSLRESALSRLGSIDHALSAPHFFAEDLGARPALASLARRSAAAIIVRGSIQPAQAQDAPIVPEVNVFGVDASFWGFFPEPPIELAGRRIAINEALAADLGVGVGDAILLSLDKHNVAADGSMFERRKRDDTLSSLRLEVGFILPDKGRGVFALSAGAAIPRNIFISRQWLAQGLAKPNLANALLVHSGERSTEQLQSALASAADVGDYGLRLVPSEKGRAIAIEAESIALVPWQVSAAKSAATAIGASPSELSVYLATEIRATPTGREASSIAYAIVGGFDSLPPLTFTAGGDKPLDEGGILLNSWAADDLKASVGDACELTYLVPQDDGGYRDARARLTVRGIVAMVGAAADPGLTPSVPGMTDTGDISQWNVPFPVHMDRVTRRDDEYWDQYRAMPKAFVHPSVVRGMWSAASPAQPAAWITAVRVTAPEGEDLPTFQKRLADALRGQLSPAAAQLTFQPVRELALAASAGSTDFGSLLLAMSMFLVVSAGALAGSLVRLMVERRSGQIGMMYAAGLRPAFVRRVILAEGLMLSIAAAIIGTPLGLGYSAAVVGALNRWWLSAWAEPILNLHADTTSLAIGVASGLLLSLLFVYWALRPLRKLPVMQLLFGARSIMRPLPARPRSQIVAVALFVLALALLVMAMAGKLIAPEIAFFLGGSALLSAALIASYNRLRRIARSASAWTSLWRLAVRSAAANPGRSLLSLGLFAAATFIIVAVAANRRDFSRFNVADKTSGAGGFSLRMITSLPLRYDIATAAGRANLGFTADDESAFAGARMFPLLYSAGDDVSCLNLARPVQARLLGISPDLTEYNGFTVKLASGQAHANPWQALSAGPDDGGAIPAFADADSAMWILQIGLNGIFTMPGPDGRPLKLRIVGMVPGSIFGSELLISEDNFRRIYPKTTTPMYVLLRTPAGNDSAVPTILRRRLGDLGPQVRGTREILNSFINVQNVYLSIFTALGGLGLLFGTVGLLAVIFRSVFERRRELALLSACGFSRPRLVRLIVIEHATLLSRGMAFGTIAAGIAVAPTVVSTIGSVPWMTLAVLLVGILAFGLFCCILAARLSLPRTPVAALREE